MKKTSEINIRDPFVLPWDADSARGQAGGPVCSPE